MLKNQSIFSKVMTMVFLLLIPLLLLYAYSNQVSMKVVEKEIENSNVNRLSFFLSQMDSVADQLSKVAFTLGREPEAVKFQSIHMSYSYDLFDTIKIKQTLQEKINLQSASYGWTNEMTLFSPVALQMVSTNPSQRYDMDYFRRNMSMDWSYRAKQTDYGVQNYFFRYSSDPSVMFDGIEHVNIIIEVAFAAHNIEVMLDKFKEGSIGEPFCFHPSFEPIMNSSADNGLVQSMNALLKGKDLGKSGSEVIELNGTSYLLSYAKSATLGWYLVDAVPLEHVLAPITTSRNLFYVTLSMLLATGIIIAYLLYKNVQVPIGRLIGGVNKLKRGDFSERLAKPSSKEFSILFNHFNHMADQIQDLIEKVLQEKIQVRDATLKQLQSQINPHFLYNCLAFIQSMAQLENKQAIVAMTQHLGKYYRYTTRTMQRETTLGGELDLIRNYLEIQKLQTRRLCYEIEIPMIMLEAKLPRLLLQPLVENAIVHGIECKPGMGEIRITGYETEREHVIVVEDSGAGMSAEGMKELEAKLACEPAEPGGSSGSGCGMWNVHQRLKHHYGGRSGLRISASERGGLRVMMVMEKRLLISEAEVG